MLLAGVTPLLLVRGLRFALGARRLLMRYLRGPDLWLAKPAWYDPAAQQANFSVLSSTPGFTNNWEPRALISKYFGRPAHVYNFGPYTVMVWDRNILSDVPR